MASVQVQPSVQLSDKEKSVIGEAVKEAQDFTSKNKDATVAGVMESCLESAALLQQSHVWSGGFIVMPPTTIDPHGRGKFTCGPGHMVKAAVIYGADDDKALPQLGYLLAWYKSENSTEHSKVYVEAGELSKIIEQGWDAIEQKLDASKSTSRSVDPGTGATAVAEIENPDGHTAWLGACFNQLPVNGNTCKA